MKNDSGKRETAGEKQEVVYNLFLPEKKNKTAGSSRAVVHNWG